MEEISRQVGLAAVNFTARFLRQRAITISRPVTTIKIAGVSTVLPGAANRNLTRFLEDALRLRSVCKRVGRRRALRLKIYFSPFTERTRSQSMPKSDLCLS
jgi:hypothetical protein